ncbi:MAG TPA: hypothetical protein VGC08_13030, partial [Pedobacter sp.]
MGKTVKMPELQESEPVVFINECLPQLVAGDYKVTANMSVMGDAFQEVSKDFWIGAPRFFLEESDIYLRCPQAGAVGHYETTLPNIMFNRRTLPWERMIDGQPAETTAFKNSAGQHAPWMGLILLSDEELKDNEITPMVMTLDEIFNHCP